jgi:hypothetical protein
MANKVLLPSAVIIVAGGLVALGYTALTLSASSDEPSSPALEAVADLPTVTNFTIRDETPGCAFDENRGGLVLEGLTVETRQTGSLELAFYVQRDSLDDILPGYVSTVLTFDEDTRSRTFDLVIPATPADYEAGYDECQFSTGGS